MCVCFRSPLPWGRSRSLFLSVFAFQSILYSPCEMLGMNEWCLCAKALSYGFRLFFLLRSWDRYILKDEYILLNSMAWTDKRVLLQDFTLVIKSGNPTQYQHLIFYMNKSPWNQIYLFVKNASTINNMALAGKIDNLGFLNITILMVSCIYIKWLMFHFTSENVSS